MKVGMMQLSCATAVKTLIFVSSEANGMCQSQSPGSLVKGVYTGVSV